MEATESAQNWGRRYQGATRRDTDHRGRFVARSESDRFWEKVHKTDTCWVWTATRTTDGYPIFRVKLAGRWRYVKAHRWAYEHLVGPIPQGMTIDHRDDICRNRACVRAPDHLEPVPRDVNVRRAAHWRRTNRPTRALMSPETPSSTSQGKPPGDTSDVTTGEDSNGR